MAKVIKSLIFTKNYESSKYQSTLADFLKDSVNYCLANFVEITIITIVILTKFARQTHYVLSVE